MEESTISVLSDPALYNNRELSLLEFNERVLEEAQDASNPILERLRFICIVASNLDEFFEVRVAGLKQQRQSNVSAPGPDAMSPGEQLAAISARVRKMVDDQYRIWSQELVPALEKNNIFMEFKLNGAREYVKGGLELTPMGPFNVDQGGCQLQT